MRQGQWSHNGPRGRRALGAGAWVDGLCRLRRRRLGSTACVCRHGGEVQVGWGRGLGRGHKRLLAHLSDRRFNLLSDGPSWLRRLRHKELFGHRRPGGILEGLMDKRSERLLDVRQKGGVRLCG